MAWPIVAIAAASAAAQYYQAEKARGANAQRLADLEAEFSKLVPPGSDLSITDPPELIKQKIPEPSYDMRGVTPEQFKVIGKYTPEVGAMVAEQRPELLKETATTRQGNEAVRAALDRFRQIGKGERDPAAMAAQQAAERQAQGAAQSRQQSILQDMQRRGGLTSGMALGAQMQGQSDLMDRLAMQSQAGAADAYRNQLMALRESAGLGRQMAQDDLSFQGRNADVINSFNQRTSAAQRQYNDQRAALMNQAQQYNLGREQAASDANTAASNQAQQFNLSRSDQIAQNLYNARLGERDRQNQMKWDEAKWREAQRQGLQGQRQQNFQNQMAIAQGRQGLAQTAMGMNTQAAQDRNAMIQGVGNAAMSGYMSYNQGQQQGAAQDRADRRAYFEKTGKWPEDDQSAGRDYGYGGGSRYA